MSPDREVWSEISALVAREASLEFDCALSELPRIAPLLSRQAGSATARFRFYRLAPGEVSVPAFDAAHCHVQARVPLTCQRCLAEVEVAVEDRAELAFIESEAAIGQVPESHDPVISDNGRVALAAVLEEQILLALPIVPMHADPAACAPHVSVAPAERADARASAPKQTPFAGLRELMKN